MSVLLSLCAIWGFTQVAIKVGNAGIPPFLQAGLRSAGSALLVWAYAGTRGVPLFRRDGSLGFGTLIAALFAGEFVFLYWGLVYTTAARGILFIFTSPFVVALGAHWFIPGERLRGLRIAGLCCAFAGLVLAVADGLRLPTHRELLGDGMELLAAVLWGSTTVVIKASPHRLSPHKTLFYQLAASAPVLAFASYLTWFWLLTR